MIGLIWKNFIKRFKKGYKQEKYKTFRNLVMKNLKERRKSYIKEKQL